MDTNSSPFSKNLTFEFDFNARFSANRAKSASLSTADVDIEEPGLDL